MVMDYVYSATSMDSIASFLPEPQNKEEHICQRLYMADYPDLLPEVYDWANHVEYVTEKADIRGRLRLALVWAVSVR